MSLGAQSGLVLFLTFVLYCLMTAELLRKGWPFRAGATAALISLAPVMWQAWFTDSDAPGFMILLPLMLLPALLLMSVGIGLALWRTARRFRERRLGL